MKRALVTGANGFIGRHSLPYLLKKGFQVEAVSFRKKPIPMEGVRWHVVDLLEPSQIEALIRKSNPSHLLHFAWYTEKETYWTAPENEPWLRASLKLMELFQENGGERIVMAGTCAEYEWKNDDCLEFKTPLRPVSVYGKCKMSLQEALQSFSKKTGLSQAWGRIFFTYGPYEHPRRFVPSLAQAFLTGEPAGCAHGDYVRDFLYVEDVAEAFAALLNSEVEGPVNIGSGEEVSLQSVMEKIAQKLNVSLVPEVKNYSAPPDPDQRVVADIQRLKNEVGWSPRFTLESGLNKTLRWWKERLKNS